MNVTLEQLKTWMKASEDEHLEFKEAKERFDFEKLVKYCVALANEGGGKSYWELPTKSHAKSSEPRLFKI